MSVHAAYKVLLDVDKDETYKTILPVSSLEWSNGMQNSYDTVANVTQLKATLSNKVGGLSSGAYGDFDASTRVETYGTEKLTNGSFTTWVGATPTSWSKSGTGTAEEVGTGQVSGGAGTGSLNMRCAGASQVLRVYQRQVLTPGKRYKVIVVVSAIVGPATLYVQGFEGIRQLLPGISQTGTFEYTNVKAYNNEILLLLQANATDTIEVTIDSVSVVEQIIKYNDIDVSVDNEVLGESISPTSEFDNFSAGVPVGWNTISGTSSEAGSGQDHTGAGTGSVNLYQAAGSGSQITTVNQFVWSKVRYRVDIYISFLASSNTITLAIYTQSGLGPNETYTFDTVGLHTVYFESDREVLASIALTSTGGAVTDSTFDYLRIQPVSFLPVNILYPKMKRGMLVKVLVSYMELIDQQLWIGKITSIEPVPNQNGDRTIVITCLDPMEQFRDADFQPEYLEDATIDVLLESMLKHAPTITFPYASSYWILGVLGASELGINTYPYAGPPMNFETGISTIAFSGDNSDRETVGTADFKDLNKKGVSQLAFIRDVMDAEVDGRFFWDGRNNEFVIHNRHHDIGSITTDAYLRNWVDGEFIGADEIFNIVTVHYQPREVGAPASVIYSHGSVIRLSAKQKQVITVRYRDAAIPSARVGAKDWVVPILGVDYAVNSQADGAGTDVHTQLSISVEFRGQGAKITLVNISPVDAIFLTLLQLRGTPIKTYTPESVDAVAGDSIRDHDIQPMDYNANLVSDTSDAEAIAGFLLNRYRSQIRRFPAVTFLAQLTDGRMRDMIQRTVGDTVQVTDEFLDHEANYTIVGEKHRVDFSNYEHYVTWVLKPASSLNYWFLGDPVHSILGVSTYPVF